MLSSYIKIILHFFIEQRGVQFISLGRLNL